MPKIKSPLLHIYADEHIYEAARFLKPGFELSTYSSQPDFSILQHYSALFVRTVTQLNKEIIEKLPKSIKYIGTASAGFDHIDIEALIEKGISFYSAAGCNAKAVAEYIQIALLWWSLLEKKDLKHKTIAIIGVGHVGSQVAHLCENMGMKTVLYDPPRQEKDDSFYSADFEDVLNADILSFHVPLNSSTQHYFREELFGISNFELVINAARGGVIDESFLLKALNSKQVKQCIIDCWENEPVFNTELMDKAFIATPHIAGYSEQAKLAASSLIFSQLYAELNYDDSLIIETFQSSETTDIPNVSIDNSFDNGNKATTAFSYFHNFLEYDLQLRAISFLDRTEYSKQFSLLRTQLPFRNEFRFIKIPDSILTDFPILNLLGRKID